MIRHISTRRGLSGFVGVCRGVSGFVGVCRDMSGFEIIGQTDIIRHTLTYDTSGSVGICRGLSGFVEPGGYMRPSIVVEY